MNMQGRKGNLRHYFRAGSVERGRNYEWRDGYSHVTPTGIEFPWVTMREAQSESKAMGCAAVFHETEDEARASMSMDGA